ncbi:MAG TPA: SpoIVB peptidase S55 domain-containing protein [Verrucomicrobiae bacterium]|nr:SpoIVB peptidase S55 domain-containing protein [Verrucomicrobiae bacterium]
MTLRTAAIFLGIAVAGFPVFAGDTPLTRPKAGKVDILHLNEIKPGMKAIAWTVFQGSEPEAVPIEIVGVLKNANGPRQDLIVGKMGGKAVRTNVAGGMSGSPVYIDGKLIGAVGFRISVFSPDAICGITPIDLMLEINQFDTSKPETPRTPGTRAQVGEIPVPNDLLALASIGSGLGAAQMPLLVPIESPVVLSGFTEETLRQFGPMFQQMGVNAVQGGAAATMTSSKPVAGWQNALNPGETIAGALVTGDMSVSGLGTVTYNDGKKVLAFGHPFFNLGPVDMPMTKGEVIMTLASSYQPNKLANATDVVGALHQDRHNGIEGVLGEQSPMIPVAVNVRSLDEKENVTRNKELHFDVFVHQKWTPYLMMLTLYNSMSEMNEFADETTYRLSGKVEMNGPQNISLANMQTTSEAPMPAPLMLASWFGDKFNRLYLNNVTMPDVKRVNVTVDLLPERRVAVIENAWVADPDVQPGDEVPVKVFLRPYRGDPMERDVKVKIPVGIAKGDHRVLLSDADTLNRMQNIAGAVNRFLGIPETVSLINQERTNNRLYVSLVESEPTAYFDDKALPSLPSSVLNVMQAGRATNRSVVTSAETTAVQMSVPFDAVVTGSYSLRIHVK